MYIQCVKFFKYGAPATVEPDAESLRDILARWIVVILI